MFNFSNFKTPTLGIVLIKKTLLLTYSNRVCMGSKAGAHQDIYTKNPVCSCMVFRNSKSPNIKVPDTVTLKTNVQIETKEGSKKINGL